MRHGNKGNGYIYDLGELYEATPKAVFAAIAASAARMGGLGSGDDDERDETDDDAMIQARLLHEWAMLHQAGIVPQAPPKPGRRVISDDDALTLARGLYRKEGA